MNAHLRDDAVEVLEARRGNREVLAADVVDGLVVDLYEDVRWGARRHGEKQFAP